MTKLFVLKCINLATLNQASVRKKKYLKINYSKTPALKKTPQTKGVVTKVTTMSPKKT